MNLKVLAPIAAALLFLTACDPDDTSGDITGQRILEKWDVKGAASTVTVFCRGPHKYVYMDGTHRGSIQLLENHPDCKETK
jgi:hypothetical protein